MKSSIVNHQLLQERTDSEVRQPLACEAQRTNFKRGNRTSDSRPTHDDNAKKKEKEKKKKRKKKEKNKKKKKRSDRSIRSLEKPMLIVAHDRQIEFPRQKEKKRNKIAHRSSDRQQKGERQLVESLREEVKKKAHTCKSKKE